MDEMSTVTTTSAPDVPARTAGCPVAHGPLSAERTPTGCPVSQRAADFDPFEDG
ncbi:MAG: cytochrome, partial [Variovorax sp.]|nr:cytochrome [Variovorax sp.]